MKAKTEFLALSLTLSFVSIAALAAPAAPSPAPAATAPAAKMVAPGPALTLGCVIATGTPGTMSIKDPKSISAAEISFTDSVAGPQRAQWNPPTVAPSFVPSLACLNGKAIDIKLMPAGVFCQMLTNNPAPTGGGAVKVVTCK